MERAAAGTSRRRFLAGVGGGSVLAAAGGTASAEEWRSIARPSGATERVEVVVRFGRVDRPDEGPTDDLVSRLRHAAASSHRAFRDFARTTDGIGIRREFWVANAVLATVDPAAVSMADLTDVEGVEDVHPNVSVDEVEAESLPGVGESAVQSVEQSADQSPGRAPDESTGPSPLGSTSPATNPGSPARGALKAQQDELDLAYGVEGLHAHAVWQFYDARGEGVDVAVLDTGVDPSGHDGIAAALDRGGWAEFDAAGDRVESEPNDPDGHGTGVSGLVVGDETDDGLRYGAAPEAALYHAKVVGEDGFTFASAVAGLEWAIEQGVDVVSLSLGPLSYPAPFVEPFENARGSGVLVVGSVGNAGRYTSASPGNMPMAIGVGAVDREGTVTEFSGGERIRTERHWGSAAPDAWPDEYTVPDVTAAGVDVPSAEPGGGYGGSGGASAATPLIAGAAALALSAARAGGTGEVDVDALEDALVDTAIHPDWEDEFAVDPGTDDRYGAGVASALFAASSLLAEHTVTGRVLRPDGSPMPAATVRTETGPWTTTDAEGRFELDLPPGEQPLGAGAPGYELGVVVIDPASTSEVELSPRPADAPSVSLQESPPERIEAGDAATARFDVANVEAVTVDASTTALLEPDQLTLRVNGQPGSVGETIDVGARGRTPSFTVSVEVAGDARIGTVTPTLAFHGNGETVRGTLSQVYVHPDPLPAGGEVPSLQAPIDLVAPGTTIELQDEAFPESGSENTSPLILRSPISLVAAEGASPRIAVEDVNPEFPAIYVTANDVTIEGVEVAAGGAASAIQIGSEPRDRETDVPAATTLRNVTFGGAATGIDVRTAPAAVVENCDVTADDVGIAVRGGQSTHVRGNEVHDVETGIAIDGLVAEVAENRLRNVGGTAIRVGLDAAQLERMGAELGPIRDNVIEGATIGIEVTPDATAGVVEGNEFRDVEAATVGLDGAPVADGGSTFELALYGLTGASIAVLLVPYARRKLRR